MKRFGTPLRAHGSHLAALLLIVAAYSFARQPTASESERIELARRFRFERLLVPELSGQPRRAIRPVNPSLDRIAAWISAVGAAVSLADLDGDGLPNDICYVDPRTDQVVVAPVPERSGLVRYAPFALPLHTPLFDRGTMAPMGCIPADVNEDGRMDLVVYFWGRTPVAFLRRGGDAVPSAGDYVPEELVPGGQRWYTNAATFADVDGDGHPDLVIGNYFPDGSEILDASSFHREQMQHSMSRALNGGTNRVLLWAGLVGTDTPRHVRFVDDTDIFDGDVAHGWTLAIGAQDLNDDLLPELYFANDFGPDRLLLNQSTPGHPRFAVLHGRTDLFTPASKVLGDDSFKGMGVAFGDLDGDGLLDIVVSNIAAEYALEESHFAFINTGDTAGMRQGVAPFVDRSEELGLSRSDWAWDVKLGDFADDGELEVVQATGFVRGTHNRWPELQELAMGNDELLANPGVWPRFRKGDELSGHARNPFFVRGRGGRFVDVAPELNIGESSVSRGIATGDVDGDGALDFVVANQWGSSTFYHNQCPGRGRFLGLHVLLALDPSKGGATIVISGHPPRTLHARPAIGATARLRRADGRVLIEQVDGGNGHSGKSSPDLLFGLGREASDSIEVELSWRDGAGHPHQQALRLNPGWHTVLLGRATLSASEP